MLITSNVCIENRPQLSDQKMVAVNINSKINKVGVCFVLVDATGFIDLIVHHRTNPGKYHRDHIALFYLVDLKLNRIDKTLGRNLWCFA